MFEINVFTDKINSKECDLKEGTMPHHDQHKKQPEDSGRHDHAPSGDNERGPSHFTEKSTGTSAQSLLERIRSMFSWIANQVTRESHEDSLTTSKETARRRLMSLYSAPNLVQQAKNSVEKLELSKNALVQEHGPRAQAFADRYIDPFFAPIKNLIQAKQEGKIPEMPQDAVGSVEILAIAGDPARLRRKIYTSIKSKTQDVILEDIAFLLSYPNEAIGDAHVAPEQHRALLRKIEDALQPILLELESLLSVDPPSSAFNDLFQWRVDIDTQRQRLHDLAMNIINEEIRRNSPYWKTIEEDLEQKGDPFLEELEIFSSGSLNWPLSIFELEETAARLREALESELVSLQNGRMAAFFERMKSHSQILIESEESEGHEETLNRIIENIEAIERLLHSRKAH